MKLFGIKVRSFQFSVPRPIVLYALLGVLDFGFTLIAFQLGFTEGNPILDWYASHGLFEAAKVGSTVIVVLLGFLLWELRFVRSVLAGANLLMAGVIAFHIFNLAAIAYS